MASHGRTNCHRNDAHHIFLMGTEENNCIIVGPRGNDGAFDLVYLTEEKRFDVLVESARLGDHNIFRDDKRFFLWNEHKLARLG